jgi:predicted ATPase
VWAVRPLPAASGGAELFCDRAAAADNQFAVGDERPVIESLCQRLDGMPLAIELAAARARAMSPTDLLARLDDRFRLLRAPAREDADERHATLQATVDWSYRLLDDRTRHVFDRMGVFASAVDLDAVAAVADLDLDEFAVVDAVTSLVDQSLVVAERRGAGTCYRLLDTMGAFARNRLREAGQLATVSRAHADWAAARVERLLGQVTGPDEMSAMAALDVLDEFWPDLRAAVHHAIDAADAGLAVRLVGRFGVEALMRERDEVGAWADATARLADFDEQPLARNVLGVGALLDWRGGRRDAMTAKIEAGDRLPPVEETIGGAFDVMATNLSAIFGGQLDVAVARQEQTIERIRSRGVDDFDLGYNMVSIVVLDAYLGAGARGIERLDTNPMFTNPVLQAHAQWMRATALVDSDPRASIAVGKEAVALARRFRTSWIVDTASNYLAAALAEAGDPREAIGALRPVLEHAAGGGGIQSLAVTARSSISVLARLKRERAVAVLAGWIDHQQIAIPGTAGMRRRVADAVTAISESMEEGAYEAARSRGAGMSAEELVAFLRVELDEAARVAGRHVGP